MHLEIIILNEVSQTEKDKYDITYMWRWKYDANGFIYKKETDSDIENKHGHQRGKGREGIN